MPRKSAAALSVVSQIVDQRPRPPADMPDAQRDIWQRVVTRMPFDWFRDEHLDILRAYCQHACIAQTLARSIEGFDPKWLSMDDGIARFDHLSRLLDREHRAMVMCARSLRLTHQSQYRGETAATAARKGAFSDGAAPWEHIP